MRQAIAVVGPTGSGKTELGIALAKELASEVISADSMQFYQGMEIGTGAPSPEELASVKHHFIGCLKPNEEINAGEFGEAARQVVIDLNHRRKIAVIVGGSGLYIESLIDGLFSGPGRSPDVRNRLQEEGLRHGAVTLFERLQGIDPIYAKQIARNDLRRIVRALEVFEISGRPMSELHAEQQAALEPLDVIQVMIEWPRADLYARVNARVDAMMEAGFLDEVRRLIEQGYVDDILRLRAVGYRELAGHLRGEKSLDEAVALTKQQTRRYAKRQLTWFHADTRINCLMRNNSISGSFLLEQTLNLLNANKTESTLME